MSRHKTTTDWRTVLVSFLFLFASSFSWAFPVHLADAPNNNRILLLTALRSAQRSLLINVYQMSDPEIASTIEEKIRAGVHVEILIEGQPVTGMKPIEKEITQQLGAAMAAMRNGDKYFKMTSKPGIKRRFRYDHAKYVVVDGESVLVSSENMSAGGHPLPSSITGILGNRGWDAWLHDRATAKKFESIFKGDIDPSAGDLESLVPEKTVSSTEPRDPSDSVQLPPPPVPTIDSVPVVDVPEAAVITSPDTSLNGLIEILRSAKKSLVIQQLSFYSAWTNGTSGSQAKAPLIEEVIAAARRGVEVKVLLNDEKAAFQTDENGAEKPVAEAGETQRESQNRITVSLLKEAAAKESLRLFARIGNLKAMGVKMIHNKGVIIDDQKVLVSSINWTGNSITNNRETAVLLNSAEAAHYFTQRFEQDWSASALAP